LWRSGEVWKVHTSLNACCLLLLDSCEEWYAIVFSDNLYLCAKYRLYDMGHQTLPVELKKSEAVVPDDPWRET